MIDYYNSPLWRIGIFIGELIENVKARLKP